MGTTDVYTVMCNFAMRHGLKPEDVVQTAAEILVEFSGESVHVNEHLDAIVARLKDNPEMLTVQAFYLGAYLASQSGEKE